MLYGGFWSYWELQHKCIFDGVNKKIYIAPEVSNIGVKENIYSEWKEWLMQDANAKYLPAIRVIGGDSLGSNLYAGDLYFLMNGWQIIIDHFVQVTGVLYNEVANTSPYIVQAGGGVVSTVSNLVQTSNSSEVVSSISSAVWANPTRTLTSTPEDIFASGRGLEVYNRSVGGFRKDFILNRIIMLNEDGSDGLTYECFDKFGNPSLSTVDRMEIVV